MRYLSPKLLKKAAQSDREQVNRWLTVLGQKGISDRVADKICGLLKEDGVGADRWSLSEYAQLKNCAYETLNDPGEPTVVGLAEHEFTYAFSSSVIVKLDECKLQRSRFRLV